MICPWRGTNSQVGAASPVAPGLLLIGFSVLIGCLLGGGQPLFSPLGGIFHSLILSRLLTACFLSRVSDLEAVQGFLCSSVAPPPLSLFATYLLHIFGSFFFVGATLLLLHHLLFFSPPCLSEHARFPGKMEEVCRRREEKKKKTRPKRFTPRWSDRRGSALFFFLPSLSSSAFFHSSLGVKTGKECVWTAPLWSLVALIPPLPSVSPTFSQQRGRDKPHGCNEQKKRHVFRDFLEVVTVVYIF